MDTFRSGEIFLEKLASASEVEIAESFDIEGAVKVVTEDATVSIPMNELVDFAAELERLNKELEAAERDAEFIGKKLSNESFVAKAPEAVVNQQRENFKKTQDKIALLKAGIEDIKSKM